MGKGCTVPSARLQLIIAVPCLILIVLAAAAWYQIQSHPTLQNTIDREYVRLRIALSHPNADAVAHARERAQRDDWWTFAHDQQRTGLETQDTGLNRDTVAHLGLRWTHALNQKTLASPLVVGGSVYVETDSGDVIALDAATGSQRWRVNIGNSVRMTPALVGDLLLVGVYGSLGRPKEQPRGASFVALSAATGAVRWRTALPGLVRSEPVIVGSNVYEGLAGGDDFSGCFNGRIVTLDLKTGRLQKPVWFAVDTPNDGGGIWAPLSTDGKQIYVGTGNSCSRLGGNGFGDAIVDLDPHDLHLIWHLPTAVPGVDDSDVGGGVTLIGDRAYVAGKSGYFYVMDRHTGKLVTRFDLAPYARNAGSIGTPTGDGDTIVITTGYLHNPWSAPFSLQTAGGDLVAYDRDLHERYRIHSQNTVVGYAAFVPGVGFTAQDRRLTAFDSITGAVLWRGVLDDTAYASPTVVPSGVYEVTNRGTVFAYGLP